MGDAIAEVKTGLITYATRDTVINNITVKQNDFIGLNDETIVVSEPSKSGAVKSLIKKIVDEDDEIMTVFSGEDVSEDELNELESFIATECPDIEAEFHQGDQPIYSFILMIE